MMNTTGLNYYLSVRDPAAAGLSATAYTCAEVFPVSLSVCPPATVFQMDLLLILYAAVTGLRARCRRPAAASERRRLSWSRSSSTAIPSRSTGPRSRVCECVPLHRKHVGHRPCHACRPTLTSLSSHSSRAGLRVDTRAVRVRISGTAAGAEPVRNPPRRLRRHPRGRRLHRGAAHRLQRSGRQVRLFL